MIKTLIIILLLIPANLLAGNTVLYDDATQTVTNKTLDCDNNTCLNFPTGAAALTVLSLTAQDEPDAPAVNKSVVWMSNGNGFGDDSDIMIMVNNSGVVKYGRLLKWNSEIATMPKLKSTNFIQYVDGNVLQWVEGGNAVWVE